MLYQQTPLFWSINYPPIWFFLPQIHFTHIDTPAFNHLLEYVKWLDMSEKEAIHSLNIIYGTTDEEGNNNEFTSDNNKVTHVKIQSF